MPFSDPLAHPHVMAAARLVAEQMHTAAGGAIRIGDAAQRVWDVAKRDHQLRGALVRVAVARIAQLDAGCLGSDLVLKAVPTSEANPITSIRVLAALEIFTGAMGAATDQALGDTGRARRLVLQQARQDGELETALARLAIAAMVGHAASSCEVRHTSMERFLVPVDGADIILSPLTPERPAEALQAIPAPERDHVAPACVRSDPALPSDAVTVAVMAESAAADLGDVLGELPLPTGDVVNLVANFLAKQRAFAVSVLEEDGIRPPAPHATWRTHDLFRREMIRKPEGWWGVV